MKLPVPRYDRPPFSPVAQMDAASVAEEIVAVFAWFENESDALEAALGHATAAIGLAADDPLWLAAREVAAEMSRGVGAGAGNAYHNVRHFCEVMLCTLFISRLAGLAQREQAQLVVAALLHDFHHDGRGNGSHSFRLELMACARAAIFLQRASVSADEQARLRTLILATEISTGMPFARNCLLRHRQEAGSAGVKAGAAEAAMLVRPELSALQHDASLALQAVILSEGDLLPSFGLTVDYADRSEALLASEITMPLGPKNKIDFIDRVIGDFVVAGFFSPNLQRIRQVNVERLARV